jgi:hypothetical protein
VNELNIKIAEVREKIANGRQSGEDVSGLEAELQELEEQRNLIDELKK